MNNILLCGNPNVGKSTLFNLLTSSHEHTGNWSGKTVDIVSKKIKKTSYNLIDLPGIYSLSDLSDEENIAKNFLLFNEYNKIIYIVDACNLEKNINLLLQISQINKNMVLCLNMLDELENKNIKIDVQKLREILGIEIVECSFKNKIGIDKIYGLIDSDNKMKYRFNYSSEIESHIENILNILEEPYKKRFIAIKLLQGDKEIVEYIRDNLGDNILSIEMQNYLMKINFEKISDEISITLHNLSKNISNEVLSSKGNNANNILDKLFKNNIIALPLLLLIIFSIFFITIVLANYPSDLLSNVFSIIEKYILKLCYYIHIPKIIYEPLIYGIYRIVSFIISVMFPPLVIFFFLYTYAEEIGLLPRIAFNFDKFCNCANCHGKQSLTICSGFGCNACAIVGSRIIDSKRDKLLAILTNSFIPCNGRFPMIIAIISMFFVNSSNKLIIALYLLIFVLFSVFISLLTSFILSKTLLKGYPGFFILEIPEYKKVKVFKVLKNSFIYKSLSILKKTIKISIPAGLIIWLMTNINIYNSSLFYYLASILNPLGKLIGLDGVILLSFLLGFPANEIVFPMIIMGYLNQSNIDLTINYLSIKNILLSNGWTVTTAMSTILFSIMHFPCATTISTIKSEVGIKWAIYSFIIPLLTGVTFLFILNLII